MASSRDGGPELLVRLANLEVARKPGRGPRLEPDPLANTGSAAGALGVELVSVQDLAALRELHRLVAELVARLLDGRRVNALARRLNGLAAPSAARTALAVIDGGRLRERLEWSDPTLVSGLARRVVHELGTVEPARLRRCARPECELVFYDMTKSKTQRWHAESPCGRRERQRRFREAHGGQ